MRILLKDGSHLDCYEIVFAGNALIADDYRFFMIEDIEEITESPEEEDHEH